PRSDFTMEMVPARQSFPGLGKRATRRASAQAVADSAAASHDVHAVVVAAEVADSFFMLAELDRRLEILDQSRERLKNASASATERYKVGKGAQADVLRANLETTALDDRLLSLKAERRSPAAPFPSICPSRIRAASTRDRRRWRRSSPRRARTWSPFGINSGATSRRRRPSSSATSSRRSSTGLPSCRRPRSISALPARPT